MIPWFSLALAGQVYNEEVALERVVASTEAAVILELATPTSIPVKIPVPGSLTKKCGTYDFGVIRGAVREVVLAPPAPLALAAGDTINVYYGNTPALIELSTRACLEGISKSPIFSRFGGEQPTDGATLLALLRYDAPYGWVEAVAGSWLQPGRAPALASLFAERGARSTPEPGELLCVLDADCAAPKTCQEMRCR